MMPKAQATKEKLVKWYFTKSKNFYVSNGTIKKVKGKTTGGGGNICKSYVDLYLEYSKNS
jgi:hypothetical protein